MDDERPHGRDSRTVDAGVLTIEITPAVGTTDVRLVGELDVSTVNSLDRELRRAVDASPDGVIVSLNGLEFIDAAGIACLLKASRGPRRQLTIGFRRPPPPIATILAMASVSDLLPYVD